MISDNVYQSMFLVYDTGVVVVDAPPAYASHIPGAIAEIAARPITHVIYSHSHSDHVGGTTKLGGNPIIIAHEETRRLLQSAADPNRPVQLQQVILNLLLNAAEAMSEVAVRARELTIRSAREGSDRVRMTVRDTGAGVDPQSMHKLFEAFYTTKRGGMGIGLSVSRSIIERHHGRLWVEPNDGPRATFALSIPRGLENKLTVISMSRCFRVARGARTRGEGRLGRRQLAERAARCFDAT
jgi:signal transduction histidine kinase